MWFIPEDCITTARDVGIIPKDCITTARDVRTILKDYNDSKGREYNSIRKLCGLFADPSHYENGFTCWTFASALTSISWHTDGIYRLDLLTDLSRRTY